MNLCVTFVSSSIQHIIGDVQVITINGANVLRTDVATAEGRGLVHVVDRVLFPPTVGDVVQTLQVDTLIVDMFFFVVLDM